MLWVVFAALLHSVESMTASAVLLPPSCPSSMDASGRTESRDHAADPRSLLNTVEHLLKRSAR